MKSKFKAVLRWIEIDQLYDRWAPQYRWISTMKADKENTPVYVIPATPAAYEAQVEAMSRARYKHNIGDDWAARSQMAQEEYRAGTRAELAAIEIKKPTKGNE